MIIRSMYASFGCLNGATLKLRPGLNILRAPNESGKSTWCAFLRCMLYGVDSARRPRGGKLPDKSRYAPWSGAPMEGRMDLLWQGREISLSRRTALPQLPMREFAAVDLRSGGRVEELHGEDAGEKLCGCGEGVFVRTALIRSPFLRVDNTGELEGRIAAILAAPSGDLSYPETEARLREWQRKLSFRGKGRLPELQEELRRLDGSLEEWERCRRETEALEEECREAEEEWAGRKRRRHENLKQELAAARTRAAAAAEEARSLKRQAVGEQERLRQSPFAAKNAVTLAEAAAQDAENLQSRRGGWQLLLPGGLFAIFALAALWWNTAAALALLGVSALLFGLVFRAWGRQKRARARAERLLAPYGAHDAAELRSLLWEFKTALERCKRMFLRAESAEEEAAAAENALQELEQIALEGNGETELAEAEARVLEVRGWLERSRGRLDALPGGELKERRAALAGEIAERERQYAAVAAALEAMEEANAELRRHYAPELSRRTEEYFRRLTHGRYDEVLLRQDLSALLLPRGEELRRESASLSQGAQDQLCLALRLALCELLLGEESCPLVLDDALLSFDEERLGWALELLEELGQKRQILLFTCTEREERYFRQREKRREKTA